MVLPRLSGGQVQLALAFLCSTLVIVTSIQLVSGLDPEVGFGALAVFQVIMFGLIIGLLLVPVFTPEKLQSRQKFQAIGSAALFFLFALVSLFQIHDYLKVDEVEIDLLVAALWLAGGILLFIQVTAKTQNRLAMFSLVLAFILQIMLSSLDVFDELLVKEVMSASLETIETAFFSLILVLYVISLLASLTLKPQTIASGGDFGQKLSKFLFRAEFGKIGAVAAISYNNAQFAIWRQFNRDKNFADFYAWQISRKLDKGRAHRTLGARQFDHDNLFTSTPMHNANTLAKRKTGLLTDHFVLLGLLPQHVFVDYGCGSLRVGRDLIDYLDRHKYWGLDVTDRFYRDGLDLLTEKVKKTKAPQCRIINKASLEEVRQQRPDFIASIAVLKHVPLNDLNGYFDKLCGMMHENTTLIVTFSQSPQEKRISGKSWAWSKNRIETLLKQRCPGHSIEITLEKPQNSRNGLKLTYCIMVAKPNRHHS